MADEWSAGACCPPMLLLVPQLKLLKRLDVSRDAEPAREALPELKLEECAVRRLPQAGGR